jgi:hypothetical protein
MRRLGDAGAGKNDSGKQIARHEWFLFCPELNVQQGGRK